ncbi:hypothetical protein [Paenibacillus piscarius]|nr:hypothetical protein [Paenibacillus piscarius]
MKYNIAQEKMFAFLRLRGVIQENSRGYGGFVTKYIKLTKKLSHNP